MADTSAAASGSAATATTTASTLSSSTTHFLGGSKGRTFLFIISNYFLWLYGFALGSNVGFASQITLIVSYPFVNLFEGYFLCGLTVYSDGLLLYTVLGFSWCAFLLTRL